MAEALCKASIAMFIRLSERTGDRRWLSATIQPYINLGRLASALGDAAIGLAIFKDVFYFVNRGGTICRGDLTLQPQDRDIILTACPELESVSRAVYVADSLKAFLAQRDFDGLLKFVEGNTETLLLSDPYLAILAKEAEVRSHLGMRDLPLASQTMRRLRELVGYRPETVVVYSLLAEIYREAGRIDEARRIVQSLVSYLEQMPSDTMRDTMLRRHIAYQIAIHQFALHAYDEAGKYCAVAYDLCGAVKDEWGGLRVLVVALRLLDEVGISAIGASRDALLEKAHTAASYTFYSVMKSYLYYELARVERSAGLYEQCRRDACRSYRQACLMPTREMEVHAAIVRDTFPGEDVESTAYRGGDTELMPGLVEDVLDALSEFPASIPV